MSSILTIDPERERLPETGIYVRAQNSVGLWENSDLAHITRESLLSWLANPNVSPTQVVLILLGHVR